METEVAQISSIAGFVLCVIMATLMYVGLHINKPFPWEKRDEDNL
jgi:hypothetical protein